MIAGALAALLDLEATLRLKAVLLSATFLVAGKQILNKARGRVYFGSLARTVCHGGKNWMESDAASHIAITLSKQRAMHAGTQFRFFFLFSLGSQPKVRCYLHLGWVFLSQFT